MKKKESVDTAEIAKKYTMLKVILSEELRTYRAQTFPARFRVGLAIRFTKARRPETPRVIPAFFARAANIALPSRS
jgi:hypothetical protein